MSPTNEPLLSAETKFAIHAIRLFLLNRGFSATHPKPKANDGHTMLKSIELIADNAMAKDVLVELCAHLELGCFYDGSPLLSGQSEWDRDTTHCILSGDLTALVPEVDKSLQEIART